MNIAQQYLEHNKNKQFFSKRIFIRIILSVFFFLFPGFSVVFSQSISGYQYSGSEVNTITTAASFLRIVPDARTGSMGDAGVASPPDANSQQYNPAKYVFNESRFGVSLSYTPWLRKLVNDINLGSISGYLKFDSLQCIAASFKYFSLGGISYYNLVTNTIATTYHPYEFSSDISYSRKLTDVFSMGTAVRYIFSDLGGRAVISPS